MKTELFSIIFLISTTSFAQSGADYVASGANLANPASAWALANNPAILPNKTAELGFWGLNRFAGTSIANGGIVAAWSKKSNALGLQATYQGTSFFNKQQVEVALGQKLNQSFSIGIALGYTHWFQGAGYSSQKRVTGKIGLSAKLNPQWTASAVLNNPWAVSDEWLNSLNRTDVALQYSVNTVTTAAAIFSLQQNSNAVYGLSLKHAISEKITIQGALKNGTEPISAGMTFARNPLKISLAASYHTVLGFTPAFSLLWSK